MTPTNFGNCQNPNRQHNLYEMVLETSETVEIRLHAADLLNKLPQAVPHRIGNWTEESVLREVRKIGRSFVGLQTV